MMNGTSCLLAIAISLISGTTAMSQTIYGRWVPWPGAPCGPKDYQYVFGSSSIVAVSFGKSRKVADVLKVTRRGQDFVLHARESPKHKAHLIQTRVSSSEMRFVAQSYDGGRTFRDDIPDKVHYRCGARPTSRPTARR